MSSTPLRRIAGVAVLAFAVGGVVACSPPADSPGTGASSSSGVVSAKTATSAKDFGGMEALVAAAKKEAALNVIALPPNWANYGEIIKGFQAKYPEIKITSDKPDGSSADEISTAQRLKGQDKAPDVFDLGTTVALANVSMFAPYKVEKWSEIPDNRKEAAGVWVNDYAGYMTVGYDSAKVPAPTAIDDLLKAEYKGKVALNGDPTKAGAAFAAVQMVSVAKGGTVADVAKGVDFFKALKAAGNFLPVDPTDATIESGQTPVVFDWAYNNAPRVAKVPTWKTWIPPNAVVAGFYVQAINNDAPHPAAARLWQEYLYSDEGQNLWLKGAAFPVRYDAMKVAGTLDAASVAKLPEVSGSAIIPTDAESTTAKDYLAKNWANAIG